MEEYCLRVIKLNMERSGGQSSDYILENPKGFPSATTSHCVLRQIMYPLNISIPPKASVMNSISLLQWEPGRTHQSCSARAEVFQQQGAGARLC